MNMAVAGILLCSVTMPLTLLQQLHSHWVFGESRVSSELLLAKIKCYFLFSKQFHYRSHQILFVQYLLCKSIGVIQSTCIFFSTYSVVLIAVDRFLFVIRPCSVQISTLQVQIYFCYFKGVFVSINQEGIQGYSEFKSGYII